MTSYRQRIYRATIGTLRVEAPARVAFEIERNVDHHPNKATLRIWNLSLDHQRQIEQSDGQQLILEAGHESTGRGLETHFGGNVRRGGNPHGSAQPTLRSEVAALDVISHAEGRDGGTEYQQSRSARSWDPGVSIATVLRALVEDLRVGQGNLNDAIALAGTRVFAEGLVVSGQTARELTQVLRGVGLRWSVQRGVLQVQRGGAPIETQILRLSPGGGLIGSPEPRSRGRVNARTIMTSDVWPGRALLLESARVNGRFTVRSMKTSFDSHTNDGQHELELEAAA